MPSLMLADRVRGLGAGQSPVRRGLQLAVRLPQVKPMFTERNEASIIHEWLPTARDSFQTGGQQLRGHLSRKMPLSSQTDS